jgi:hypothetical protein
MKRCLFSLPKYPSDPPGARGAGLYGAPCAKKAHGWRAWLKPGRLSDPSGGGKPTISSEVVPPHGPPDTSKR